jgi:hypothetical protein
MSALMGRPWAFKPEHVAIVRELRNAHPDLGIARLVAADNYLERSATTIVSG